MLVRDRIVQALLNAGARLAREGEFTERAFLQGKMDLIQAEAVIDLIKARTELAASLALSQLGGQLSQVVKENRQEILDILAYIEAGLDFPEEDAGSLTRTEISLRLEIAREHSREIHAGSKTGKILREGLSTVIAGKPNVGKSSLLNALLKEERAIVTDVPGTTRDEIHEHLKIGNILLHLVDTAGIHASEDPVEIMGIERTWKALNIADVILFLLDARDVQSGVYSEEEKAILEEYREKCLVIINKIDLLAVGEAEKLSLPAEYQPTEQILFSVKKRHGFTELEDSLSTRILGGGYQAGTPLLANIRQITALEGCLENLSRAEEALTNLVPLDLVSLHIRAALEDISLITGDSVQDDLIAQIFSQFCLGK
jgi:tRNA modification GTPase